MKNKTIISIFCLIAFAAVFFTACSMGNPIMEKWWVEPEPEEGEPEYIALYKYIPQVSYDTIIEEEIVYKTVFVQLPPEIVYETVYKDKPVYKYIYVQLPPEVIYKTVEVIRKVPEYITVYQDVIKYVQTPPDKNTIIEWLEDPANKDDVKEIVEKIKELYPNAFTEYVQIPPEVIYQQIEVIKEVKVPEYITVYQDVIEYVQTPPDKESIIQWLKDPDNENDVKDIIDTIKEKIPEDVIKEIIKEIPPKDIITYLTDEQIQYIVKQQPPQKVLQSIKIIGIEYVLFAGDSSVVNGPPGPGANSVLTTQEQDYNTSTIREMAKQLVNNPTYIIMLHGHANPTQFTDSEKGDLTKLSNDRATDVRRVLLTEYNKLPVNADDPAFNDRVSTSGYGGEKTLFGNNTQYTALNRRVEMILFEIVTTVE